jgi:hypothetical protein
MAEQVTPLNRKYRDRRGHVVHVIGYEREAQRVIYRRDGYEYECAAPLILFRSRFIRVEK